MSNHTEQNNESGRRRRWPWFLLLGIILLAATIRLSLKTDFVRGIVKSRIVAAANAQLTVNLSVNDLKGDLWKEAILTGLTIAESATDSDTLASVDSISVSYNLMSYFQPVFEISEITVSKPFLKLRQQNGTLNLSGWTKPFPQDTTASEPFPVRVDRFSVNNGRVDAHIEALDKDSTFVVDNISLNSSFALLQEGYEAKVSDVSFDILQTRLDEAISFESKLQADKHTISLEKLVLATGNSVLQSSGRFNVDDTTTSLSMQAEPLAWRDIAAYTDQFPVKQNLDLDLSLKGSLSQFSLGLDVGAKGIEDLKLGAELRWDSTLTLTKAEASASRLNLAGFLSDSAMPDIRNFQFNAEGDVPLQHFQQGILQGTLAAGNIRYDSYLLDETDGTFTLKDGNLRAGLNTRNRRQRVQTSLNIEKVWSSQPGLRLSANGQNINPGYWLQDDQYEGNISFTGKVTGEGLIPGESKWDYQLDFDKGTVSQQNFNRISLQGTFGKNSITNKTLLRLVESEVTLKASLKNYQDLPQFSYEINTQNFDLSECRNIEAFTSDLSVSISGEGRGASLETLQMQSAIRIDSSVVNGERIESLAADIAIKDTVATISYAELQSSMAEGSFNARLHLSRWYDTDNELNLDLVLKDLQPLAPLANIDRLQAEGTVRGNLAPVDEENLKFTGNVDLKNLAYNEQFQAERASGEVEVLVKQEPEYTVDLEVVSPAFSTVQLQDLLVQTSGKISETEIQGIFNLNFIGANEGEIIHAGRYRVEADSSVITTEKYDIKSSLHTLVLQQPFQVVIKDQAVRTDTMKIAADDGTSLELAVPYADSVRQEGYLIGRNLNLSLIQNTLLSEAYFEGMLSGNLSVANSDTSFKADGRLLFSELNYLGTTIDSVSLGFDIGNDQLKGNLSVIEQGDEIVSGALDLPFRFGDPQNFDETFFEKPVEGSFRLGRVALSRFDTLLSRMGMTDTEGILQVTADLKGTAGDPQLNGNMKLDSAAISGVKVDSLTANLQYVHDSSTLSLNATVNSLKQRAAEIKAEIPFYVDLKKGILSLPDKEDSLSVDIETNNFNLAAFNDFVDREQVRNISGRVNGMVHVTGTLDELYTRGELDFTESSVRIVTTGVRVEGMRATLIFEPNLVTIKDFRARSGGVLNMNGNVAFEELVPGDINLNLRAKNFRIANTSQYNAVIDLDTKVTGSFTQPDITGSLSVLSGFVQLDNFGEKSVESVQLDSSAQPENEVAIYDSLAMEMDVSFDRRFFIRNQRYLEMEIELDGSVDMVKDAGADLQMFGSLETASGYARPLGKRFELEEGVVTFTGDPTNPDLNIRTLFEPPRPEEDIMIWYIIGGSVEDPSFRYESSPPMELEDILCYTLFGQPCFALESWKRAIASTGSNSGATGLAMEILSDRIETLATQSLGIDVVRIENTRVGGDTGTAITTGWYINPKTFFAIQNIITGSTPDTSFLLEYMLMENLMLILSQGNESGQGVDLRWNYDY